MNVPMAPPRKRSVQPIMGSNPLADADDAREERRAEREQERQRQEEEARLISYWEQEFEL